MHAGQEMYIFLVHGQLAVKLYAFGTHENKRNKPNQDCCRGPPIVLRQGNPVAKTCDPPLVTPTGPNLLQLQHSEAT